MNDEKKEKNIKIAREVWRLRINEKLPMSAIAKELNINKTEVSYILKYTKIEMYMTEYELSWCLKSVAQLSEENQILHQKLDQAQKPWYKKLFG